MSLPKAPTTARLPSTLSVLHNLQTTGGTGAKVEVAAISGSHAGAHAGATDSDLSLHGQDKKQQQSADFAEATGYRLSEMEKQFAELRSMMQQLMLRLPAQQPQQQQESAATAAASASTATPATETKNVKSQLSLDQEARLAAVKDVAFGSNASILGATMEQKKAILAAIDSKVSSPLASSAGSAGSASSAAGQQAILDHQAAVRRQEEALQAKITTLGKAKTYPELNERVLKRIVEGASDKYFVAFMTNHATMLAKYNDSRSYNAASYYHYELMDKLAVTPEEDKKTFYQTNVNGHVFLISEVAEKFPLRSQKQQQQHGNRGGKRGGGRGGDSFRGDRGRGGGNRGGGRGSSTSSTESSLG